MLLPMNWKLYHSKVEGISLTYNMDLSRLSLLLKRSRSGYAVNFRVLVASFISSSFGEIRSRKSLA